MTSRQKSTAQETVIYCHPLPPVDLIMILTNKPPYQQGQTTASSAQMPLTEPVHDPAINQLCQDRGTTLTDGGEFELYQFAPWMLN